MATTANGWPYVEPADHPLEYPAVSQQLANMLDAASGWQTWSPTPAGATYSSLLAAYTKRDKLVVATVKAVVATVTGDISFTVPPATVPHADQIGAGVGMARCSVAAAQYHLAVYLASPNLLMVRVMGTSGLSQGATPTHPATWQAGNQIVFTATWRAAS